MTLEADETSRVSGTPPTTGGGSKLAHQLFFKLGGVYGDAWTRQYQDEKALACATTEWTEALARFDFPTIKRAFEYARANIERPPTLPQFVGLCRQFRRTGAHQLALPPPPPPADEKAVARQHIAAIRSKLAAQPIRPTTHG